MARQNLGRICFIPGRLTKPRKITPVMPVHVALAERWAVARPGDHLAPGGHIALLLSTLR
jgi:hypothetical protein